MVKVKRRAASLSIIAAVGLLLALPAAGGQAARAPGSDAEAGVAAGGSAAAAARGTRIVHLTTRRDAGIWSIRPGGGSRHRLRRGLIDAVALSRSGRRMAFASSRPTPCSRCVADFTATVHLADGLARGARMVRRFRHATVESLAISPNGRWIVASIIRGADADLFRMRADGSRVRALTSDRRWQTDPAFSPDGRRIAFAAETGRAGTDIFTMRRRGGGRRRLTRGGANSDPAYSPNGRLIAYSRARGRTNALHLMRSDGRGKRRLTNPRGSQQDINADFSPGGRSLVFARGVGIDFDLFTIRTSGRNLKRLAAGRRGMIEPDWTRVP